MLRRTTLFCSLALTAAAPWAQAIPFLTPKVTTEHDHTAQFSHRTYSWGDTRMPVAGYADTLRALVDKGLKARGWQLVPSGGSATVFALGDVANGPGLIAYYARSISVPDTPGTVSTPAPSGEATPNPAPVSVTAAPSQPIAPGTEEWAQNWGPQGWGAGWKPGYGLQGYNALGTPGTHLVLDVFDTGSHQLLFRGVTDEDLSNSEKKNNKALEKSLKQILKGLPKA